MEDVYYLVHVTRDYSPKWKELKPSPLSDYENQYPGVYFSIVTKQNIDKIQLYPGKQILLFSKLLLDQQNYHINKRDYNGYVSEENTYYPWNLKEAIENISDSNEVVFHDPISMKHLCAVISKSNISYDIEMENNMLLPALPLYSDEKLDVTTKPFLCYPLENNYRGINPIPQSSNKFFKKMAEMCGVNSSLETNVIIKKITEQIPQMYKNRDIQNISYFDRMG